jgi:hypothetical protein
VAAQEDLRTRLVGISVEVLCPRRKQFSLQDLDILVRGTDPDSDLDPTIIKQKQ